MDTRLPRPSRLSTATTAASSPFAPGASTSSFSFSTTPAPSTSLRPKRTAVAQLADMSMASLSRDQVEGLRRQSNYSTLSLSPRRPRTAASGSQATERGRVREDDTFDGGDGEEEEEEGMVERMRNWRNDAMTQHLYGTAEFWGGKVFGMTGNPNDAFWLAQTHFLTHQYSQAEHILTTLRPAPPSTNGGARRLTDSSLACRYLAAQCQVRLGKWEEALEMVGRGGGLLGEMGEDDRGDGGVKLTSSTAHLRGLIHLHLGATDLAKESFIEALSRDVKCFESFQVLVGGEMMSTEEEWEFIQGLNYQAQTGEDADFVRMMYTVRLKKVKHHDEMSIARRRLTDEYGLGDDPDVMFGLADEMYAGMRFAECYKVTSKILAVHSSHRPTLPLHLSCMHHLPHLRSRLFLLAHELVESEPDDAISWYAVGLWYFSGRRWEESRRFFGKSVLIDSRFGPSWIAFAHSYAFEGEHDQAITAYSTALRHFQGTHLPLLFIGMQHLGLANVGLAKEYLEAARKGCEDDPLVENELGVVADANGQHGLAIQHFSKALQLAKNVQGSQSAWSVTHLNLGHSYRKAGRLHEAHDCFRRVIQLDPRSAAAYSALGLVEHKLGNHQQSIARYHEVCPSPYLLSYPSDDELHVQALSILPGDPITNDLLRLVLASVSTSISSGALVFPGLPLSVLRSIDESVRALDGDILLGGRRGEEEGGERTMEGERSMEGERTMEGESEEEGETMDMSG